MLLVALSVALGVIGGLLLKAFYSMVRQVSPRSYTYSASHLERSRGKWRRSMLCSACYLCLLFLLGSLLTAVVLGLDGAVSLFSVHGYFPYCCHSSFDCGENGSEGGGICFS